MSTRSYIRISGDDRVTFLQGILTQDVTKLAEARIQFAALLSPQGKLLHDMFLIDEGDSILIDTDATHAELLQKRLTLYKLRAKAAITRLDAAPAFTLPDPRHALLPPRDPSVPQPDTARIALGIPEFGTDIAPDTITGMDAGYDLLNGISFTKGCYVGQEVTARMHYKSIARKGFFFVRAMQPLAVGDSITAGERAIGTVTSVAGDTGLAFLKFEDAIKDAHVHKQPVMISAPDWMAPKLRLFEESAAKQ